MLYIIIVGLIAGSVAGVLVRGKGYGCFVNVILGILGAWLGNLIFDKLEVHIHDGFLGTILTAIIGAVVFLLAINIFKALIND